MIRDVRLKGESLAPIGLSLQWNGRRQVATANGQVFTGAEAATMEVAAESANGPWRPASDGRPVLCHLTRRDIELPGVRRGCGLHGPRRATICGGSAAGPETGIGRGQPTSG